MLSVRKNVVIMVLVNQEKLENYILRNFHIHLDHFTRFTSFLGFKAQSDEWKLMGASAYGKSLNYAKKLKKNHISS